MRCPKCDSEIKGFKEFCSKCGTSFSVKSTKETSGVQDGVDIEGGQDVVREEIVEKSASIVDDLAIGELYGDTPQESGGAMEEVRTDELPLFEPVDLAKDDDFKDKGWDKWEKSKLEFYESREVKEASKLEKFGKVLSGWIKQIDPENYEKIASKIKVLSLNEYPLYQVSFSTVFEKRDNIEAFEVPFKNEKLCRKTVKNPEDIDLWGYRTTNDIIFLGSQKTYAMPNSMYTEKCVNCGGKKGICTYCQKSGKISCTDCQGSGKVRCKICRGSTKSTCFQCKGGGMQAAQKCFECGGTGLATCKECKGGYLDCEKCHSKGKVDCSNCEGTGYPQCKVCHGSGRVLKGYQFTSTFKAWSERSIIENSTISRNIIPPKDDFFSSDTVLVEVIVKKLSNYDFLEGIEYADLKTGINDLIQGGFKQLVDRSKIRRQKLTIKKYPIWVMRYVYENKNYIIYFRSKKLEVFFVDSPFKKLAEEALSRAKRQLFLLNFSGAIKSCRHAGTVSDYQDQVYDFLDKIKKVVFYVYCLVGMLGAAAAGWIYVNNFLPTVEHTFNASLPKTILLVTSVFIGFTVALLSRIFVGLSIDNYRKKFIIPVFLAALSVFGVYFGVFQWYGFNPYKALDRVQFEREFKQRFPYGVPSVYNRKDHESLKEIAAKYKKISIDLSRVKNGIAFQEKLKRENIRKSKNKVKKKSRKSAGYRSKKSEQKLDFFWMKKKKR